MGAACGTTSAAPTTTRPAPTTTVPKTTTTTATTTTTTTTTLPTGPCAGNLSNCSIRFTSAVLNAGGLSATITGTLKNGDKTANSYIVSIGDQNSANSLGNGTGNFQLNNVQSGQTVPFTLTLTYTNPVTAAPQPWVLNVDEAAQ